MDKRWHLANLSEHQAQAINELENRMGLVLIAYTREAGKGGAPVDWEFGREFADFNYEEAPDGPQPEMLAALNETYRSGGAQENATGGLFRRRR